MNEWQPFGSEPKRGEQFIAYRPDVGVFAVAWCYPPHEDGIGPDMEEPPTLFTSEGEDLTGDLPTHWMPLPPPPTEKGGPT